MDGRKPNQSKKAGSSGLFRYGALAAVLLLLTIGVAAAEPLRLELDEVQGGIDRRTNEPIIMFKMSETSRKLFADLTPSNVGSPLAMRIDGVTVSTPVIREPITGGRGQISGHYSVSQVSDIVARLSSGRSKLEVEIVK